MRIKVKKLRYAIGFFDSLFSAKHDEKRFKRLTKFLKGIQDGPSAPSTMHALIRTWRHRPR